MLSASNGLVSHWFSHSLGGRQTHNNIYDAINVCVFFNREVSLEMCVQKFNANTDCLSVLLPTNGQSKGPTEKRGQGWGSQHWEIIPSRGIWCHWVWWQTLEWMFQLITHQSCCTHTCFLTQRRRAKKTWRPLSSHGESQRPNRNECDGRSWLATRLVKCTSEFLHQCWWKWMARRYILSVGGTI